MTPDDLIALSPLIVTAVTAVVVMLVVSLWRQHHVAVGITLVGLVVAAAAIPYAAAEGTPSVLSTMPADRACAAPGSSEKRSAS